MKISKYDKNSETSVINVNQKKKKNTSEFEMYILDIDFYDQLTHLIHIVIFPRRKFQNSESGTNFENFYHLQNNSMDNLKQI